MVLNFTSLFSRLLVFSPFSVAVFSYSVPRPSHMLFSADFHLQRKPLTPISLFGQGYELN